MGEPEGYEKAALNFRRVLEGAGFENLHQLSNEDRDTTAIGMEAKKRIDAIITERDQLRASHEATSAELGKLRAEIERLTGERDHWAEQWEVQNNGWNADHDSTLAELGRVRAERDELCAEVERTHTTMADFVSVDRVTELRTELAAAYQKGREDMRDEAAILAASLFAGCSLDIRGAGYDISTAIRAIPTDGREGK